VEQEQERQRKKRQDTKKKRKNLKVQNGGTPRGRPIKNRVDFLETIIRQDSIRHSINIVKRGRNGDEEEKRSTKGGKGRLE